MLYILSITILNILAINNALYVYQSNSLELHDIAYLDENKGSCKPTPKTIQGPLYISGAPFRSNNDLTDSDPKGLRLKISGKVLNADCEPIAGAVLDIWQADSKGKYHGRSDWGLRGKIKTDEQGNYNFITVLPGYEWRLRHIHLKITRNDYKPLTTQIYFATVNEKKGNIPKDLIVELNSVSLDDTSLQDIKFDFILNN